MAETRTVLVSRAELAAAFKIIASAGSVSNAGVAILRVSDGVLRLERAGRCQEIPVQGDADFSAQFELDFARLGANLPDDDPIEVGYDGSHLAFGRYRRSAVEPETDDLLNAAGEREKQRRIARAVKILEPYFVKAEDLHALCAGTSDFSEAEQALTDRIAKAWAELAPFGLTAERLKELISGNLKNAWRR